MRVQKSLCLTFMLGMVLLNIVSTETANSLPTASWNTQTVDSRGAGGTIIIDSQNRPHIFYHEETIDDIDYQPQGLFYAVKEDQEWIIQHLNGVPGNTFIMDKNNNPHIVSIENGSLIDTPIMGSNWNLNQFGVERIADKIMKLDSRGNLHTLTTEQESFAENNSRENCLYYYNWTKTGNSHTLLAKTRAAGANFDYLRPISIVVDSQNNPRVIFNEQLEAGIRNSDGGYSFYTTSSTIEYARYDGIKWGFETIAKNVSESPSDVSDLVLDSKGYPHLCYVNTAQRSIDYTYFNGDSWISQTVDEEGYSYFSHPALRLDRNGNPQVYYYQVNYKAQNRNGLMAAQWTGTNWDIKNLGTIPFNPDGGSYEQTSISSIVFDSYGNPYVLYCEVVGTYRSANRYGNLTLAFLDTTPYIQSLILPLGVISAITAIFIATLLLYRRHRKNR